MNDIKEIYTKRHKELLIATVNMNLKQIMEEENKLNKELEEEMLSHITENGFIFRKDLSIGSYDVHILDIPNPEFSENKITAWMTFHVKSFKETKTILTMRFKEFMKDPDFKDLDFDIRIHPTCHVYYTPGLRRKLKIGKFLSGKKYN